MLQAEEAADSASSISSIDLDEYDLQVLQMQQPPAKNTIPNPAHQDESDFELNSDDIMMIEDSFKATQPANAYKQSQGMQAPPDAALQVSAVNRMMQQLDLEQREENFRLKTETELLREHIRKMELEKIQTIKRHSERIAQIERESAERSEGDRESIKRLRDEIAVQRMHMQAAIPAVSEERRKASKIASEKRTFINDWLRPASSPHVPQKGSASVVHSACMTTDDSPPRIDDRSLLVLCFQEATEGFPENGSWLEPCDHADIARCRDLALMVHDCFDGDALMAIELCFDFVFLLRQEILQIHFALFLAAFIRSRPEYAQRIVLEAPYSHQGHVDSFLAAMEAERDIRWFREYPRLPNGMSACIFPENALYARYRYFIDRPEFKWDIPETCSVLHKCCRALSERYPISIVRAGPGLTNVVTERLLFVMSFVLDASAITRTPLAPPLVRLFESGVIHRLYANTGLAHDAALRIVHFIQSLYKASSVAQFVPLLMTPTIHQTPPASMLDLMHDRACETLRIRHRAPHRFSPLRGRELLAMLALFYKLSLDRVGPLNLWIATRLAKAMLRWSVLLTFRISCWLYRLDRRDERGKADDSDTTISDVDYACSDDEQDVGYAKQRFFHDDEALLTDSIVMLFHHGIIRESLDGSKWLEDHYLQVTELSRFISSCLLAETHRDPSSHSNPWRMQERHRLASLFSQSAPLADELFDAITEHLSFPDEAYTVERDDRDEFVIRIDREHHARRLPRDTIIGGDLYLHRQSTADAATSDDA